MQPQRRPTAYRSFVTPETRAAARGPRLWGNHFCNEDVVSPIPLSWSDVGSRPSVTAMRLLPGRNYIEPDLFDAYRYQSTPGGPGIGDHARLIYAWRRSGYPKVTFALYNPDDYRDGGRFDTRQDPFCTLYWTVKRAAEGKAPSSSLIAAAAMMLGGGDDRKAVIQRPTDMCLFRALIMEWGTVKDRDGKPTNDREAFSPPLGLGDGEKVPLVEMAGFTGRKLLAMMDVLKDGVNFEDVPLEVESDDEWAKYYEMPDPVAFNRGVVFYVYPAGGFNPLTAQAGGRPRTFGSSKGQAAAAKGYEIAWRRDYTAPDGATYSADLSDVVDELAPRITRWTPDPDKPSAPSVLKFLSMEEKVALVANSFRLPSRDGDGNIARESKGELQLDLLEFAWQDFRDVRDMIPANLIDEARGRKSLSRADAPAYRQATPPRPGASAVSREDVSRDDESLRRISIPGAVDDDVVDDDYDVVDDDDV